MTQDEIIEMAIQAGDTLDKEWLQRFAKLVAAKEREACAKVCEKERRKGYDDDAHGALGRVVNAIRARGEAWTS